MSMNISVHIQYASAKTFEETTALFIMWEVDV